jgi:LysM repeat protein
MKLYQVQAGDTLSELAEKFSIPFKAILFANPEITNPDYIQVGQIIRVPEMVA